MNFQKGDIVILIRPDRNIFSTVWTFMKEFVTFFFMNRGLIELIDKCYHIELGGGMENLVVTQEPPKCHVKKETAKVRVFRLKTKPLNFDEMFDEYVIATKGMEFDWRKFWALVLGAIFHTDWFANRWKDDKRDMCAEFVARFYMKIGIPCLDSNDSPDHCLPSDVKRYCSNHPELFEEVV